MKIRKMLYHDCMEGIVRRKVYLLLPIFMVLITCIGLHRYTLQIGSGSFMDYWIYLIQGKKPYKFDLYTLYEVPVIWIMFYTLLLVSLNSFPTNDLGNLGYQMIVRSKSRFQWWLSKSMWCVFFTAVYFLVSALLILLYAYGNGIDISMRPTVEIMQGFGKVSFLKWSMLRLCLITIVQPFLLALFSGMLQMALGFIVKPVVSFCIVFSLLMVSAYTPSYFLPGNWGMPYRIDRISKTGLNCNLTIVLLLIGIGASFVIGYYFFKRKDIFSDEK